MSENRDQIAAEHGISDNDRDLFLTATDDATLRLQAERLSTLPDPLKGNRAPREGQTVERGNRNDDMRHLTQQLFGRNDD